MSDLIKYAVMFIALIAGLGIKTFWPEYPDDNIVEESIEIYIKDQTGMDIDITPLSPEKK